MTEEAPDYSEVWQPEALLGKAKRYAEKMLATQRDDWQFALWSSLTLEFILRAALADYDQTLLADAKADWQNIYSAAGYPPTKTKFTPKSISTREVIDRLAEICPDFNSEIAGFSRQHVTKRNAELHSGMISFDGEQHSSWLPQFYQTCAVLLKDCDSKLADVFGDQEAATADKLIAALADEAAKAVKATIAEFEKKWAALQDEERKKASSQASLWATRRVGHRVICPACQSDAIVTGDAITPPTKSIAGDIITEKQEYLPSRFECIACGLKIAGLSQLTAAGLGDVFMQSQSYDASEYYSPPERDEEYEGWEPDNNEPM